MGTQVRKASDTCRLHEKIATVLILLVSQIANPLPAAENYNYYSHALQGDLSAAEKRLSLSPDTADKKLLDKFRARFVERTHGLSFAGIGDLMVNDTALAYQAYWQDALLRPDERRDIEDVLLQRLGEVLAEHVDGLGNVPASGVLDAVAAEIRRRGYHVLGGRTPPLLELMLWRVNEKKVERIELVDGVHDVPVTYAADFVTLGWSHFATFGRSSTGGWATREGLFCVLDSYDTGSEKFAVSFLKHEGRHFADYRQYPSLRSADLEYRAKLTELAFATDSIDLLMQGFRDNAARNVNSPHALANWHVVNGLRDHLRVAEDPRNNAWWMAVPRKDLAAAAKRLLQRNDRALEAAGGSEASGVLE